MTLGIRLLDCGVRGHSLLAINFLVLVAHELWEDTTSSTVLEQVKSFFVALRDIVAIDELP